MFKTAENKPNINYTGQSLMLIEEIFSTDYENWLPG
jgi:hypothetical protein